MGYHIEKPENRTNKVSKPVGRVAGVRANVNTTVVFIHRWGTSKTNGCLFVVDDADS